MLPELITEVPGPKSRALAAELKRYECRNVTYVAEDWPVFWQRADGSNVWDEDGNRYLDLTAAFGVAGLGHGWAAGVMREQSEALIHGMGDVHPTGLKVELCKLLSELTYERWGEGVGKSILSNSGFEAVESALKTAVIATGKQGIVSFKNSYHGLGYGALLRQRVWRNSASLLRGSSRLCASSLIFHPVNPVWCCSMSSSASLMAVMWEQFLWSLSKDVAARWCRRMGF